MATRLNNMPRPVGNAIRYIRAGARLLKRTVTRKGRRVEIRFNHDHESVGVAQPQPRLDSQLEINHHSDGAESNTTNHDMITSSPLPLTLSTNDSVAATSNSIGTSPSQQESMFDSGEYEADLVLSAALVGDKHVQWCATTEPDLEPEPWPVQADSADQNINERLTSSSSAVGVASNIYNSLKSTKAKIDNFVKWYRRELQRRNLI